MLMSSKNRRLPYIQQTGNLKGRLHYYNQGLDGTNMTNEIKNRKWSLLAYIVGFDNNHGLMLSVEASWEILRCQAVSPRTIYFRILAQRVSEIVENNSELTLVLHFLK